MNKLLLFSITLLVMLYAAGCSDVQQVTGDEHPNEEVTLIVSAAASLTDALDEIKDLFEQNNSTIKVTYNFGSSGTLQQQIIQGAPADLFFSAAEDKFDELVDQGVIDEENSIDLVGNEIVLVTPLNSLKPIESFRDLGDKAQSISIGTPETVPAGMYARELLENLGEWEKVEDKMVFAKDVRQVLTYVETGNVDAGIVYNTDALISSEVTIVELAQEGTHKPIIYPVGVISESENIDEAKIFYEFMQSEEAIYILEKYGFLNRLK